MLQNIILETIVHCVVLAHHNENFIFIFLDSFLDGTTVEEIKKKKKDVTADEGVADPVWNGRSLAGRGVMFLGLQSRVDGRWRGQRHLRL